MATPFSFTVISHACVKFEGDFGALLCDPWFVNEPVYNFTTWKFPDVRVPPEDVAKGVTHLFVSHGHEDHFHIPSIDLLSRDIEVLLPEYTWHPGLRAQTIERTFRTLGFHRVRKIMPWETISLGQGVQITMLPAAKSKPQDWENAGLVVEHASARVLNMNDNPSDDELYEEVSRRFDHFDIVLVQYAGVSSFPGRFKYTEEEMRDLVRKKRTNFDEQKRAVENLDFNYLIPFAGDFCWLDDRLFHCNWASRATPMLFKDWFEANYSAHGGELAFLYPSDRWVAGKGFEYNHPTINWGNYLEAIAQLKTEKQPKIDAINEWLHASSRGDLRRRTKTFLERMERWVGARREIDFDAKFRFLIKGENSHFSFVLSANPDEGFGVFWDDDLQCDQIVHVEEFIWASILEGKLLCSTMHWISLIDQTAEFRVDMPKFWWWIEFYADLNNRSPQVLLERQQYPSAEVLQPQKGVFPA